MAANNLDAVKEYYGKTLNGSRDLKTGACCTDEAIPGWQKKILAQIEEEVISKFYGCGSPVPLALEGCTVLDLGCGTGRDVFLTSALVGREGEAIGIDMTEEQLDVGRRHTRRQMERFGYNRPNVSFRTGYIEDLAAAGIEDESIDVVISNCVINLSPDKRRVLSEIFRVLKPGGELYFSDVFADRRIPEHLRGDRVLYGECLSGAMYTEDFRRAMNELGFPDYRIMSRSSIDLEDDEIEKKIGMVRFHSITVRAFKLKSLEDRCEDYGQVAVYRGSIAHAPHAFRLDDHHHFVTGKPLPVCGNTAAMLEETRFNRHFEVTGDRSTHFGLFDCGDQDRPAGSDSAHSGSCC